MQQQDEIGHRLGLLSKAAAQDCRGYPDDDRSSGKSTSFRGKLIVGEACSMIRDS